MSGTKILWGQVTIVCSVVLIAVWGATQWTAWRLGFQPQLGRPWFELWPGIPVYVPPAFFWWWYVYDAYAPGIFLEGGCHRGVGQVSSRLRSASAFGVARQRDQERGHLRVGALGEATGVEPQLAGPDGVCWAGSAREYLRHDGPEHVMASRRRARQGRRPGHSDVAVLAGSAVVHDIKGENWQLTAGWRARSRTCLLFNPTDPTCAATTRCWKCARDRTRSATSRTSPTSWSIPKARSNGATIGKRPATPCWSAPSCTSSMPRRRRRWPASRPSSPIRGGRSSTRCAR